MSMPCIKSTIGSKHLSAAIALAAIASGAAWAQQTIPRSFEASPDVYKVIAENSQYRVISVTWKPGQRDQLHAHPASAVYNLTDCSLRIQLPDGAFREVKLVAGAAIVQPPVPSHVLENIGTSECRLIMFEPA